MTSLAATLGTSFSDSPLRKAFLRWQCRVRQTAMRDNEGRPDDGIIPAVFLPGEDEPMGHIITLLNKAPGFSLVPEFKHMAAKTNDPAQRREQALKFLSATYYQKSAEFADMLTATFPPGSPGAATLRDAGEVRLRFEMYAQVFDLTCKVWRCAAHNPLREATMAHNALFNPTLPPDTEVLAFEPQWDRSSSIPEIR